MYIKTFNKRKTGIKMSAKHRRRQSLASGRRTGIQGELHGREGFTNDVHPVNYYSSAMDHPGFGCSSYFASLVSREQGRSKITKIQVPILLPI